MSITAVFDASGRCSFVLDGDLSCMTIDESSIVLQLENSVDPNKVWYDTESGRMLPRTPFPVVINPNQIASIPPGTEAIVGDEKVVVDSGTLELEVDYPETVRVVLLHVRHLDTTVEVPCEAAG